MLPPINPFITFINDNQTITIQCNPIVDCSQSTFIYEQEELDSLSFTLQNEGSTYLVYCLKDKYGNILEENQKEFFLDTTAPEIKVSIDDFYIDSEFVLWDECTLQIDIEDASKAETKLYVDGQSVDFQNELFVTKENKEICIECCDEYNNKSKKILKIDSQPISITSNIQTEYTTQSEIVFDSSIEWDFLEIEEYLDGEKIDTIKQGTTFDKTGFYQFILRDTRYPYLVKEVQSFTFTNQFPSVVLPDSYVTNQNQILQYEINCPYFKSGNLMVNGQYYSLEDTISFEANDDEKRIYQLQITVQDLFDQTVFEQREYVIDRRHLNFDFFFNNTSVEKEQIYFTTCINYDIQLNKEAEVTVKQWIENQPIYTDLYTSLQLLKPNQTLVCQICLEDGLNEPVNRQYIFYKLNEVIEVSETESKPLKRIWSVKEDKVLLKEEKEEIMPVCKILVNGQETDKASFFDTIQIVFLKDPSNYLKMVKINGKEISMDKFKTNSLSQFVYEFKAIQPSYKINVIMENSMQEENQKDSEIKVSQKWLMIFIIPILFLIKKLYEKNSNISSE